MTYLTCFHAVTAFTSAFLTCGPRTPWSYVVRFQRVCELGRTSNSKTSFSL